MGVAAPVGLGATVAGTGLNAYGQNQAERAMNDAWDNQMGAQRGYDSQLNSRTQQLINQINPNALLQPKVADQTLATLNTGSNNAANAVAAAGARKTGGARGGAEAQARNTPALHATLASALQDNHVQAALRALNVGGQNVDMLGRQYAVDAGNIRGDAQRWAGLVPLQQQAAGLVGGEARQIGSLFSNGGQAAMMYGMSQPASQPAPPRYTEI
jgi:hypothetical protein